MRHLAILFLLNCLLAPAWAQEAPLPIERGQAITLSIDAAGEVRITGIGDAPPMSALVQGFAAESGPGGAYADAYGPNSAAVSGSDKDLLPLPEGAVRFTLAQVPGANETVLSIDNGLAQALTYRAVITVRGRSAPTDVCLVRPNFRGFEHWPYLIDRIDLREFRLQDWREGDPLPCRP